MKKNFTENILKLIREIVQVLFSAHLKFYRTSAGKSTFRTQNDINKASPMFPPEKLRTALFPEYGHSGAYLLLRCKGSTAVSIKRPP